MDISDVRKINLQRQIGDTKRRGAVADFARTHGLDPTYIRQLLSNHRTIGEKSARNIEQKVGLPSGFLDNTDELRVNPPSELDQKLAEAFQKAMRLPADKRELILKVIEGFQSQ